jgi:hypothetical protein
VIEFTYFAQSSRAHVGLLPPNCRIGKGSFDLLRHGMLLVFGAPCQLPSLAGQEHGRTIPLAEV